MLNWVTKQGHRTLVSLKSAIQHEGSTQLQQKFETLQDPFPWNLKNLSERNRPIYQGGRKERINQGEGENMKGEE